MLPFEDVMNNILFTHLIITKATPNHNTSNQIFQGL